VAGSFIAAEMSIRVGVTLVALAPIALAVVMETRNELMRRLLYIASRDQLTGLLNRHAFREKCHALLNQLVVDAKSASLLMIDIDHFKSINDTYGHSVGDHTLAVFSKTAGECLRHSDVFGRLGGEEFAVLLPDCQRNDVQTVAERIREAIAAAVIDVENILKFSMIVSIGAAFTDIAPRMRGATASSRANSSSARSPKLVRAKSLMNYGESAEAVVCDCMILDSSFWRTRAASA